MRSEKRGEATSEVEVTNVSKHGFWLLLAETEIYLPFEDFPWFRDATIGELTYLQLLRPNYLYWPDLDVDLTVESIEHPERYPLVSKWRPNKRLQRTAKSGR